MVGAGEFGSRGEAPAVAPLCASCGSAVTLLAGPRLVREREICPACRARDMAHIDVDRDRVFCAHCWKSQLLASAGARAGLVFDRFMAAHAACRPGEPI